MIYPVIVHGLAKYILLFSISKMMKLPVLANGIATSNKFIIFFFNLLLFCLTGVSVTNIKHNIQGDIRALLGKD